MRFLELGERWHHDRLWHHRRAVGLVTATVRVLAALRGVQHEAAIERACIRIHEQLGRVEAMTVLRRVGSLGAQPVARTHLEPEDESVKDIPCTLRQRDPRHLALAHLVEQTERDRRRMRGVHRDVRASINQCHAEWLGGSGEEAAHAHDARCSARAR